MFKKFVMTIIKKILRLSINSITLTLQHTTEHVEMKVTSTLINNKIKNDRFFSSGSLAWFVKRFDILIE